MAQAPAFARGGDSAQEADDALSASRGGSFRKIHYLPEIGKGKSIYIRYITDSQAWYHMLAHPSAPTKNKSNSWPDGRNYPTSMPAVCRYDDAFKAQFSKTDGNLISPAIYTDCYICDAKLINTWGKECKPVVRVWAIACIREEVIGTSEMVAAGKIPADRLGKRVGFRDATREYDEVDADGKPTGNKKREIALVVVNKAVSNYFGGLQALWNLFDKTICDRDFVLMQKGEKKDVDFQHVHLEPTASHKPGTESWKRYEQAIKDQGLSIEAMLTDRSSDDFYATFFDPSKEPVIKVKKGEETSSSTGAPANQQAAAPTNEPDQAALQAMRDRVRSRVSGEAEASGEKPPQSEAPSPTSQDVVADAQPVAAGNMDFDA